jgi:hypothetical protein
MRSFQPSPTILLHTCHICRPISRNIRRHASRVFAPAFHSDYCGDCHIPRCGHHGSCTYRTKPPIPRPLLTYLDRAYQQLLSTKNRYHRYIRVCVSPPDNHGPLSPLYTTYHTWPSISPVSTHNALSLPLGPAPGLSPAMKAVGSVASTPKTAYTGATIPKLDVKSFSGVGTT